LNDLHEHFERNAHHKTAVSNLNDLHIHNGSRLAKSKGTRGVSGQSAALVVQGDHDQEKSSFTVPTYNFCSLSGSEEE